MENAKNQFPSQGIVDQIKALPKFNADVSRFISDDAAKVAEWAFSQDGAITLNVANVTPEELVKFQEANKILAEGGKPQIVLFNEKAVVDGITGQITVEVVDRGREAFRDFILKVLKEEPELLVSEFNQFAAPRGKGYYDVHYWDNIGLGGDSFYKGLVGNGVEDMFDKLVCDGDISGVLEAALDGKLNNINTPKDVIDDI